jgi:hypothetical protein
VKLFFQHPDAPAVLFFFAIAFAILSHAGR